MALNTQTRLIFAGVAILAVASPVRGPVCRAELPPHAVLRLGTNAFAHGRYMEEIAFTPDSSEIITIGPGQVRVWAKSGELARSLPPEKKLTNISFSPDSRWRMGSASLSDPEQPGNRGWFRFVTNLVTGETKRSGPVRFPAYSMSISADGRLLAVGDPGAALSLVDNRSGKVLDSKVLPGPANHAGYPRTFLSPDGALLLAHQPDHKWYVFDLKNRDLKHPLPGIEELGRAKPVFSSRKGIAALVGWNGQVVIRNFYTGTDLISLQHGRVTALDGAFSPDETTLATCGADGFIRLWDADTGRLLRQIDTAEGHARCMAFSADGQTLISGGGQGRVRFWNVRDGAEIVQDKTAAGKGAVKSVAISPNGKLATLASGLGEVTVWDLRTGERLGLLPDKDIQGGPFDPWIGHNFMAFTPQGRLVAGSSNRHNSVNLWDANARQRIARFTGHRWPITCVACSPDAELIVSGSRDKTVCAWDSSGKRLWQATGNGEQILTLAISPDGKRVYSAGHTNIVDVWQANSGERVEQIVISEKNRRSNATSAIAVSRDGKYLAAVLGVSTSGRRVVVTRTDTQQVVLDIGEENYSRPFGLYYSVAFHPRRDLLAVGEGDGAVTLYQMPSGKVEQTLRGHTSAVTSLAWSPVVERLLSGSLDGSAMLWDTHPGLASK